MRNTKVLEKLALVLSSTMCDSQQNCANGFQSDGASGNRKGEKKIVIIHLYGASFNSAPRYSCILDFYAHKDLEGYDQDLQKVFA